MQQTQANDTNPFENLTSGWRLGCAPTPETIRQGTVRMEEHPDYEADIQKAKDAGFEVRFSGEASIEWTELYDLNQNLLRIRKVLNVATGMRYIDLEHELGHIEQFTTRFGDTVPPLEKKIEFSKHPRREANDALPSDVDVLAGIMSEKKKAILEYHNRLIEFIRLYKRGVDVGLLKEHAYGPKLDKKDGIEHWYRQYLWATNKEMSKSRAAWIAKHLPDLIELQDQYKKALEVIEAEEYRT
jgi:hypothetical protein